MSKGKRVQRDWPAVLASHLASGLSVAGFCRQERIAESLFYSWRQRCAPGTPSMAAAASDPLPRRTGAGEAGRAGPESITL